MGLLPGLDSVIKVAKTAMDTVTKPLQDAVKSAALRLGLPEELANVLSDAMDPTKLAGKMASKVVGEVCDKLGLPDKVKQGLQGLVEDPTRLVKAFATGGVGGVIKEIGDAIGLPPELTQAISLAVNVATQNYAAAAADATKLAKMAAEKMGLPKEFQAAISITAALVAKDADALKQGIGEATLAVADRAGVDSKVLDVGVKLATGDTEGAKRDGIELAKKKAHAFIPDAAESFVDAQIDAAADKYVYKDDDNKKVEDERNRQVRG